MNILKTYIPMFMSVLFFLVYFLLIGAVFKGNELNPNLNSYFIVGIVIIIAFLIEWICFLVHAAKNKKLENQALWIVLIYLFNVFIVPYYNFKYVVKVKNIKMHIAIYIILSVVAAIIGLSIPNSIEEEYQAIYIRSQNNEIEFTFYGNYEERNMGEYDLYASDFGRQINVGAFIYNKEEEEITSESILEFRDEWIRNAREDVELKDTYTKKTDDKTITSNIYYGKQDNDEFIYQISTISFNNSNYIINTFQIVFNNDYAKYKDELNKILIDIKIVT